MLEVRDDESAGRDAQFIWEQLTEREREILIRRYGLAGNHPCTLKESAGIVHISPERVRQIEKEALHKLNGLKCRQRFLRCLELARDDPCTTLSAEDQILRAFFAA